MEKNTNFEKMLLEAMETNFLQGRTANLHLLHKQNNFYFSSIVDCVEYCEEHLFDKRIICISRALIAKPEPNWHEWRASLLNS